MNHKGDSVVKEHVQVSQDISYIERATGRPKGGIGESRRIGRIKGGPLGRELGKLRDRFGTQVLPLDEPT